MTLTAAARSIWPGAAPTGALAPPPGRGGAACTPETGRGAVGTGGFPGTFGFEATGGGAGFGFVATGGGLFPIVLAGREPPGLESVESDEMFLFHGAAEPFAGAMPGNTATAFACASAWTALSGVALTAGAELSPPAPGIGGDLRPAGGGGGCAWAAFGLGGTSSR